MTRFAVKSFSLAMYLLAVCAVVMMVGCGSNSIAGTTPTPTPTPTPATSKPVLVGLVAMGPGLTQTAPTNTFAELNAHPGVYSAAVINLTWAQLEPTQGTFDDTALTTALANLATYNAQNPTTPVVGKLRIFMGLGTPAWVIAATGGVTITDSFGSGTAGEFWTPQYDALWVALQNHLASEFDTNAMVGEVAITSCSSLTGEPFIVPQDAASVTNLHAAGYTDALQQACLSNAANDYAAWKNTPLDYTINQLTLTDVGNTGIDTAFPVQVMTAFRTALGTRGVVANHGFQPTLATNAVPVYTEFQTLYSAAVAANTVSPLEFQSDGPTVDWTQTIPDALTYHPTEFEMWDTTAVTGGQAPLTQSQLASFAAQIKAQYPTTP